MGYRRVSRVAGGFLLGLVLAGCGGNDDPQPADEPPAQTDNTDQGGAAPEPGRTIYVSENPVSCEDDSECDDGDLCNGVEACDEGICVYGETVNCNDGIACTADECDSSTGECTNSPPDEDGDGHGDSECEGADGAPLGDDCDDNDANRYPGNQEVCIITFAEDSNIGTGDGRDEDCNPDTYGQRDADGDGFVDVECYNTAPSGERNAGPDCNDRAASINPAASEVCDYFDNNCNDEIDEGLTVDRYDDPDGDGYGGVYDPDNPTLVTLVERAVCPGEVRVAVDEIDCAPEDRLISPDRDELCDGVDNNCNGLVDENVVPSVWYRDFDGDGYGNPEGGTRSTCERIDHLGWSLFLGDCDDTNPMVNPSQPEMCDGLDNDCNPATTFIIGPGNGEDDDGDGVADPLCGTTRPDCVDTDATIYPGARELCDGLDNDCNGIIDTRVDEVVWYVDNDGDGYGVAAGAISSCEPIAGRVTQGGDCNDSEPSTHPGANDDCSGTHSVDDDCDGEIDEGETPVYQYRDLDMDGYGDEEVLSVCQPIAGDEYTDQGNDCNEADPASNPGAAEDCSPDSIVDLDCDGLVGCADLDCVDTMACEALYGLQVVSPASDPIVAFTSSTFDVTISLTDSELNPIVGADVAITGSAGTLAPETLETTDGSGEVTFTIGVGMAEQGYDFTVTSGSTAPLMFTVDAQLPDNGVVWSVLNRDAPNSSATVESTFGPNGRFYYPFDIEVASDGGAFICGYYDVGYLDPLGQFSIIAGNGTTSLTGDGGPAQGAGLNYPRIIALDEARNVLYVATTTRLRQVRLGDDPPTIHAVAGGGSGAIPGPAELADIGTIVDLAVQPDGHLLISTTVGLLDYDPSPISKQVVHTGIVPSGTSDLLGFYAGYAPHIYQEGNRTIFWTNWLQGGELGTSSQWGMALYESGDSFPMVTTYSGAPNSLMVEGAPMHTSHTGGYRPSSALFDSAENLIFAPEGTFGSSLWKVDATTQRASRYAGGATEAIGDDFVDRLAAQFRGPIQAVKGPNGDIWIAERHAYGRVRRIRGGVAGTRSNLNIDLISSDGDTYWPGEQINATIAQVTDDDTNTVSSILVEQVPTSGWAPMRTTDDSDVDGVTFNDGRAEIVPGDHSVQTQIWDLQRNLVDADVLSYSVQTPPSGSVSSWFNANFGSSDNYTEGGAALTSTFGSINGMTTTSTGEIYISTGNAGSAVYRIELDGTLTRVAGGNGSGASGDFLPAIDAQLYIPSDLAVDEVSNRLYIQLGTGAFQYIRVVDLTTGIITPFAGYGSDDDETFGTPVLDRASWQIFSMQTNGTDVYIADPEGIHRIDTTADTPTIETWIADTYWTGACTGQPLALNYCTDHSCRLAFRDDGKAYLNAYLCGTSVSGNAYGIALVSADGVLESLVSGFGTTVSASSYDALDSINILSEGLVLDSVGNLYFSEPNRHWIRRITPGGQISTVAGSDSSAWGNDDFVAGADARFYYPRRIAVLPDDSVLIVDTSNRAIRRYWP